LAKSPEPLRVLLDECLPRKLKREFAGCVVFTVQEMGWSGKKNGELMKIACDQFDIFVTADQNLQYQQNLAYADVAVIVLVAVNNRIENLTPLMPQVNALIGAVSAGQVIIVGAETTIG
jgi:predicted nuclease of predicted toxin-antitoxin system